MTASPNPADSRRSRLLGKVGQKDQSLHQQQIDQLRSRADFTPELDYFLQVMENPWPAAVSERTGRPLAAILCLQAPLELFQAFGWQPFKIYSGSYVTGRLAANDLPAIMCPMLRSALGAMQLQSGFLSSFRAWVLPTTCDWVVKFTEMMKISAGLAIEETSLHRLELPHLKDQDDSRERWLEEIYKLKKFLEKMTGRVLKPGKLREALETYQRAYAVLSRLTELRRQGAVPAVWFTSIANSFFYDTAENWTAAVARALPAFEGRPRPGAGGRVFLAGSPIFFPNFKLLELMEEAGLTVVADDLCSSERLFPGAVNISDHSEFGLLSALAERYHQGCLCPTFADNDRRVNNIINPAKREYFEGVVFQVLKGCHPYDLESFSLAGPLQAEGLKFLRLETDYTAEDSQNLLTRLEAYRHHLEA
jgi:benzoyl-CoA reductase/2-hydroxyglutaryl-CoA dehydratase subunit BcrC/BadD/HgdB